MAHVLNHQAMEVLEDAGVAEVIADRSTPAAQLAATAFYAGSVVSPRREPELSRR